MTLRSNNNHSAADERAATKHRSRRLLWRLVAVRVFVVVSTFAVICRHPRYPRSFNTIRKGRLP